MSKREKILSSIAFILSIIPFILVVLFVKIIPADIEIIEDKSIYDPLLIGFLCAIPLAIVIAIGFLKESIKVQRDMTAALAVCCLLSILFTFVVIVGILGQIDAIAEILTDEEYWLKIDIWGVASILLCLLFALLGGFLNRRTQGDFFAINNQYTRASVSTFNKVHALGSHIAIVAFSFMAVVLSFFSGWQTIIVPVIGVICFFVWAYLYSRIIFKMKHKKARHYSSSEE